MKRMLTAILVAIIRVYKSQSLPCSLPPADFTLHVRPTPSKRYESTDRFVEAGWERNVSPDAIPGMTGAMILYRKSYKNKMI